LDSGPDYIDVAIPDEAGEVTPASGEFTLLTYNVAGLPQGFSSSNPEVNMPQISPLLNAYNLVLAQEDFSYHAELSLEAEHPDQSIPYATTHGEETIGDGLNRFSDFPFSPVERIPWPGCNGLLDCASDCLATKGFSVARHTFAGGLEMDIYNLHMEAGGCPEDETIREDSMTLLLDEVATRSNDIAVIIAGDFNLHHDDAIDLEQLQRLLDVGFLDSCWSLDCGDEHIDRIFFRGTDTIELNVQMWSVPPEFVTPDGEDLSDHEPVTATIQYVSY
jgi:endonuclease/exonuclease/phosphatase family metal-dependent hydrolase